MLLHDGGGYRRETVRSLPMLIEGIRARGYQIVPVYQLLGKTRTDLMPPIPANERWSARLNLVGFELLEASRGGIYWIFLLGDVLMTARLLCIGAFAVFDRMRRRREGGSGEAAADTRHVVVLSPAFNGQMVVDPMVRAV